MTHKYTLETSNALHSGPQAYWEGAHISVLTLVQ